MYDISTTVLYVICVDTSLKKFKQLRLFVATPNCNTLWTMSRMPIIPIWCENVATFLAFEFKLRNSISTPIQKFVFSEQWLNVITIANKFSIWSPNLSVIAIFSPKLLCIVFAVSINKGLLSFCLYNFRLRWMFNSITFQISVIYLLSNRLSLEDAFNTISWQICLLSFIFEFISWRKWLHSIFLKVVLFNCFSNFDVVRWTCISISLNISLSYFFFCELKWIASSIFFGIWCLHMFMPNFVPTVFATR